MNSKSRIKRFGDPSADFLSVNPDPGLSKDIQEILASTSKEDLAKQLKGNEKSEQE